MNRYFYTGAETIDFIDCTDIGNSWATNSLVRQTRIGGDPTKHRTAFGQYRGQATSESSTAQRHTASDFSWKIYCPSNSPFTDPISFLLAKIACTANELRTVKLWVYRCDANAIFRLRLKGGYLAGIDQEVLN